LKARRRNEIPEMTRRTDLIRISYALRGVPQAGSPGS
jgi:hypothetical protein